jgi:GNAT superfamily N-acetyltransferase
MVLTIRAAVAEDAATLVSLVHQFEKEEGKSTARLTVSDVLAQGFGARPRFRALMAERAGQAVGYAMFYPSYDSEYAAKGFYLQDLFVASGARRQGVGRALMAAVSRACLADGGCYLFWNALETNRAARAFYRRIGGREEPVVTLSLQPAMLSRLAENA